MRLQLWLNLRRLVLALIALLSFGAILLNQSDGYLRASAAVQNVKSVNAASYEAGPLARGSLASVFGNNLASRTEKSQDATPPTKLGDVTVQLTGNDNVTRDAGLVLVSPQQINFVIPDGSPLGKTQMVIKNGDKDAATGEMQIADASPALFTSDSGGGKLAVGMTNADGSSPQSLVNPDGSARMIGSGAPWAPTTLTLLATGLRYAESVQVLIGDQVMEPMFVRPGIAPGVDEVGVRMPMNLRNGMNKLSLVANTRSSATATSGATTQAAGASQSSSTTATSNAVQFNAQGPAAPGPFTLGTDDVKTIIAQAVAKAQQMGVAATIAVLDTEGNPVGIFKMNGARSDVLLGSTNLVTGKPTTLFPPNGQPQDPGGHPIYKNGVAVGGVGVEFDGLYSIVVDPTRRFDQFPEEVIAVAAVKGYRALPAFQADNLLIDGMRLDFTTIPFPGDGPPAASFDSLRGTAGTVLFEPRGQLTSGFSPLTLAGIPGRVTQGFFPFKGSQVSSLTAADVTLILSQAAKGAYGLRAAIRRPVPQPTEVNITVVDTAGNVLGLFSTQAAPQFGFDV